MSSWREDAACRDHDEPGLWFGGPDARRRAQAVCERCPVRGRCLDYAADLRITHGIWGGLEPDERTGPDRECPRCGASGDDPCVTSGGVRAPHPHADRADTPRRWLPATTAGVEGRRDPAVPQLQQARRRPA